MTVKATSVEVAKQRGVLVVRLIGRTPRGTKYIKKQQSLKAKDTRDPLFKTEMATAVKELFESG